MSNGGAGGAEGAENDGLGDWLRGGVGSEEGETGKHGVAGVEEDGDEAGGGDDAVLEEDLGRLLVEKGVAAAGGDHPRVQDVSDGLRAGLRGERAHLLGDHLLHRGGGKLDQLVEERRGGHQRGGNHPVLPDQRHQAVRMPGHEPFQQLQHPLDGLVPVVAVPPEQLGLAMQAVQLSFVGIPCQL